MKKAMLTIALLSAMVLPSYADVPFRPYKGWGGPAPYGEGRHPGIDYQIPVGTPIIAISDGKVIFVRHTINDGSEVAILHGGHFISDYAHLSKILVDDKRFVKRGQLIGLSGESNNYNRPHHNHLHFGLCMIGVDGCHKHSNSYDPNLFWLGGKPQCFDSKMDYSVYKQKDITFPISCGSHLLPSSSIMAGDPQEKQEVEKLIVGKTVTLSFLDSSYGKTGNPQFVYYDPNGTFVKTIDGSNPYDYGRYAINGDGSHCYLFENKDSRACWIVVKKESLFYLEHKKGLFIAEITFEDGDGRGLMAAGGEARRKAADRPIQ